MGLRETFKKAAQTAISAIGNVAVSVTYVSITGDAVYNPVTGVVTEKSTSYSVNMMFDENLAEDIKNIAIDINEKLGYIAVDDLTPTPKTDDRITIDSVNWAVTEVRTDPADALWIIKIKKQ